LSVEIDPPAALPCPPHYWLIENLDSHTQQWTRQRCGAEQAHDVAYTPPTPWAPSPRTHKATEGGHPL